MSLSSITGLVPAAGRFDFASLRRGKTGWAVAETGSVPFSGPDGAPAPADVKALSRHLRGRVVLGIPGRDLLLRTLPFPATDPEELAGMAGFEAAEFSPFPDDEILSSAESLAVRDGETFVLSAILRRDRLDEIASPLLSGRVFPDAVDALPAARARNAAASGLLPPSGPALFVSVLSPSEAEAILFVDAVPAAFSCVSPADPAAAKEDLSLLLAQADAALAAVEEVRSFLFCEDPAAEEAAATLASALSAERPASPLPSPAEGLARRALEPASPLPLSLVPADWTDAERSRHARRSMMRAGAVFLAVWALGIASFLALDGASRHRLAALEREVAELEAPALEVRRMLGKLAEWNLYADRSHSALETLRLAALAMPEGRGMELTSFVYRKGESLAVRGEARDAGDVYEFIRALERSGAFETVRNEGVTTRSAPSGTVNPFGVTAVLPAAGGFDESAAANPGGTP